jgi:glycosyltransferase involved in cell wall biosynthesis
VLFVGRVIPNKRFEDLIKTFHVYKTRFNPRARLLLVGSYAGFDLYLAMLQELIARLRTPDVHFLGHVSNEELSAVYDIADVFLCASEHEGFCVPLVEAFHKGVPVLAYAATAVPATMDGAGVLFETKDPYHVAGLVDAVVRDQWLADGIVAAQDAALRRLRSRDFDRALLGFVERALAAPAPPHPEVAFDFWDQYAQAERLEELRQYRPALYQALPYPPVSAPGATAGKVGSAGDATPAKTGDA